MLALSHSLLTERVWCNAERLGSVTATPFDRTVLPAAVSGIVVDARNIHSIDTKYGSEPAEWRWWLSRTHCNGAHFVVP